MSNFWDMFWIALPCFAVGYWLGALTERLRMNDEDEAKKAETRGES